jgi:class 3 adenylate cyclase
MALLDDLETGVAKIFKESWTSRVGRVVPAPEDIGLGNDAVELKPTTVLYADLDGSTNMVDMMKWQFAAEIYKTYLYCASRLIRNEGGTITSYDGDRVMGIFLGDAQVPNAARCALKINYAVKQIINPAIKKQYQTDFQIKQTVGIDTSDVRAARTGVRGDNDIVWVGRAPNYAAKLTSESSDYPTWITAEVYNKLDKATRIGSDQNNMWKEWKWSKMNNIPVYSSTYWWKP